ncbi:MAG: protein kinase [Verrucomicrobiales bacterium]
MPLQKFRSFDIAEDAKGASLELWRGQSEVVCLASDPTRLQFAELHVLSSPDLADSGLEAVEEFFRDQAQGLMRVCHPNVIELREFGDDEGTLFFITEFIDGESLDSYLARCNPLPAWLALEIARQLTEGLLAVRGEGLLARVDLFNARLILEGETTSDLVVKLCEFGLAAGSDGADPGEFERRCVRDVGRLVLYALSGLMSDKLTAKTLASLPVPAELGQLLTRLLESGSRQTLTDLEALEGAIVACGKNQTLSARPERLPVTLRPRLPLHSHFFTLAQLGEKLSGYRLERAAFDALQPYAQRAFGPAGMPVNIQLLPPVRLLAPGHLALLKRASARMKGEEHPHLLRILDLPAGESPEYFIEEAVPRHTVDAVRRLRKSLAPAEVAHLLQQTENAVAQAEKLGLTAVVLAPQHLYLEFAGKDDPRKQPTDEELARLPVHDWPTFRLRLRAYPTMLNIAQPHRFRLEKLLGKGSRASRDGGPAGLRAVETADYAALALSLFGGEANVPEPALSLIEHGMAGAGEQHRRKFLDQLCDALAPRPSKPRASAASTKANGRPAARPSPADHQVADAGGRRLVTDRTDKKPVAGAGSRSVPALKPVSSKRGTKRPADSVRPREAAPKHQAVAPTKGEDGFDFSALTRGESEVLETEQSSAGFAEVLFGSPGAQGTADEEDGLATIVRPGIPVVPLLPSEIHAEDDEIFGNATPLRFQYGKPQRSHFSMGRLVVLIVLAALVIALVMAHVTGLAPWASVR